MAVTIYGQTRAIWAVHEPKPIINPPPGRIRLRLRNNAFATAFVKNGGEITRYIITETEDGTAWELLPKFSQGTNLTAQES